jgi:hypothetical protein
MGEKNFRQNKFWGNPMTLQEKMLVATEFFVAITFISLQLTFITTKVTHSKPFQ